MKSISHVLVPVNGKPGDEDALQVAFAFAKKGKAMVTAVHVVEVRRALPLEAELPSETNAGEQLLEHVEEMAQHYGCQIKAELLQARSAGVAIVDEAFHLKADLIIMALPYRSRFGEFHLGETSNYILNHATCRVWLVRDSYDTATEPAA
jgi:nucleotide-binding universal stress UspA family protein